MRKFKNKMQEKDAKIAEQSKMLQVIIIMNTNTFHLS